MTLLVTSKNSGGTSLEGVCSRLRGVILEEVCIFILDITMLLLGY